MGVVGRVCQGMEDIDMHINDRRIFGGTSEPMDTRFVKGAITLWREVW